MAFLVFWGVVSLLFAGFVSADAKQRGMNGTVWAIGTLLLMIPVFPFYMMIRKPVR